MKREKHMTHRLLAFFICLSLILGCMPVYAANAGEDAGNETVRASTPTTLWVEPSGENGLPLGAHLNVFKKQTGNSGNTSYIYQIYLPGNADREKCYLSWDGGAMATTPDGTTYESGDCPIPLENEEKNYTFKNGNQTLTQLRIVTYQGSPNVTPVFIEIDESQGSIAQMQADKNNTCSGTIFIDGQQYVLEKMKGRGNASWSNALDKKPYNINLGSKINFPGVDSEKTKKWTLLAEVLDRSLMCNRTGFHLAHELGVGQDTTSADVWMNGEYQGCYTVTPKTDSFVNKNGYMIEQDNYKEPAVADGGDPQFTLDGLITNVSGWSSAYNYITVKKIGSGLLGKDAQGETDESPERLQAVAMDIQAWLQDAWDAIRANDGRNPRTGKYYTEYIDIESFAKMYLMQEYVKSYDICAGSIYFHRDGNNDSDKLIAGPIWDLDNAMGSVYNNDLLGSQARDRRSGAGDFIPNINEYKTSIYKTISRHNDFMTEVKRQYNKYHAAFDAMESDTNQMMDDISASAIMNHRKVEELGHDIGKDNHYYAQPYNVTTSGYQHTYMQTNGWADYAENLKTYIKIRSLWFHNKFYDENYVCEHEYEPVVTEATCTADGIIHYVCKFCGDVSAETETIPKIPHDYQDGNCTVCGEKLITVTIDCDDGASVTVYETKNLNGSCEENAAVAHPRDSDSGLIDCGGSGQVNFVVNLKPGYEFVSDDPVSAEPVTSYKNLKKPDELGENTYRLTKVNNDLTIRVRTEAIGPVFTTHNLVLSGRIGVNFYMDLSMLSEEEREASTMEFTLNGKNTTDTFDPEAMNPSTRTYYGFTCYLNSIEMADEITAVFRYADDKPEVSQTYSVKQYIDEIHENSDEFSANALALINSIADYGHYVQPFLAKNNHWTLGKKHIIMPGNHNYEAADVSSALTAVQNKAIVWNLGDSQVEEITYSLDLESETAIYIYLKMKSGYTGSVTALMDGNSITCAKQKDGRYRIKIDGIAAHQLGDTYDVRVSAEGECSVSVSPMSYVLTVLESRNSSLNNDTAHYAVTSLYRYYKAAIAYIEHPND